MTPTQLEQAVLDNLGTISTTTNSAGQFHRLTLSDGEGVLIYGNMATLTLEVELFIYHNDRKSATGGSKTPNTGKRKRT